MLSANESRKITLNFSFVSRRRRSIHKDGIRSSFSKRSKSSVQRILLAFGSVVLQL